VRSGGPRPGSRQVLSIAYDSVQAWRLGKWQSPGLKAVLFFNNSGR